MDTSFAYGRTRRCSATSYHEAHELVMRAWTEQGPFAFNGRFNRRRYVNLWPRPMQQPHPPIWIPGGGRWRPGSGVRDRLPLLLPELDFTLSRGSAAYGCRRFEQALLERPQLLDGSVRCRPIGVNNAPTRIGSPPASVQRIQRNSSEAMRTHRVRGLPTTRAPSFSALAASPATTMSPADMPSSGRR